MKIILNTEISNKYDNLEVTIHSNTFNEQVQTIVELLQGLDDNCTKIIAKRDNNNFIINVADVICFYSENKSNYCKTDTGSFIIKETLYELENKLSPTNFIRISNSCIANIDKIECFNTEFAGTIKVKFKDNSIDYVSRRRINDVIKKFKGGF